MNARAQAGRHPRRRTEGRPPTPDSQPASSEPAPAVHMANPAQRRLASGLVVLHFAALFIGLSANLAPSYLQGQLLGWLGLYSVTTNQDYTGQALELTHAGPIDGPLLVQLHRRGDARQAWQSMELPGASPGDPYGIRFSRWANFARMIRLIVEEQPESEILSDIAAQFVRTWLSESSDEVDVVRLVAPPVLSFDEQAIVAAGQASMVAEALEPTVVFSARVIADDAGKSVQLVPAQAAPRTSKPLLNGDTQP